MRYVLSTTLLVLVGSAVGMLSQTPKPLLMREFDEAHLLDDSRDPTANISLGDLDGDRDLDIVLAKGRHDDVLDQVLINNGKGRFVAAPLGTAKDPSYSALLFDVDHDRDLDIVVSNDMQLGRVYVNDGKGKFTESGAWGKAGWPTRNAAMGDLNGDGAIDVIAANRTTAAGRRSGYCLGDRKGGFPDCVELAVGPATTIVPADFDRDGDIDLAVPFRDGGQSVVLYNDAGKGFSRSRPFGPDTAAARVAAAGDLNGDGWPDLVLGDERISAFVHLNDKKGGLLAGLQLKFDDLPAPYSMAIGDLNRDGHMDIVIGYASARGSVLFNDGTGRHYRHVRFGDASAALYGVALGDLDGDGYLDIAAARNGAPNVVYFSRPGTGVPRVAASEEIASPTIRSLNPEFWKFGVWRGQAVTASGYKWDVEVGVDNLRRGQSGGNGTSLRSGNGVPFCRARLTLLEVRPDGVYVFSEVGQVGCGGLEGTIHARWRDASVLEWSWAPPGAAQRVPATLTRTSVSIPWLPATAASATEPLIGTWRGVQRGAPDDTWGMEVSFVRLTPGQPSGRLVLYNFMPGGHGELPFCSATIALKERHPDRFVFELKAERGECQDDEFTVRQVGSQLRTEFYWSGPAAPPDATGVLDRKK